METDPIKIAFAGDWHGNKYWACNAIEYAAGAGAQTIIHLGDYGYKFSEMFRNSIETTLARTGLTLQFVDGNHEDFPFLYRWLVGKDGRRQITSHVFHLPRGYRWTWGGVRFLAVGGAYSVDRQWREADEWWEEETITDEDIACATNGGPVDVLVSHDAPSGFIIPGIAQNASIFPPDAIEKANEHRTRLRDIVDVVTPKAIWHGHYHVYYKKMVDLGYGPVWVAGLNMDGTRMHTNINVIDLDDLKSLVTDTDDVLDHI